MRFVPHSTAMIAAATCLCFAAPAVLAQEGNFRGPAEMDRAVNRHLAATIGERLGGKGHTLQTASSAEQLKAMFLDCERQASTGLLDMGSASHCSLAYEELKRRVFDGDFNRLMAWWRAYQAAAEPPGRTAQSKPD